MQLTNNVKFYEINNESLLFYGKTTDDLSNILFIIVNLDPYHTQSGWVKAPIHELGIDIQQTFLVHDLISEEKYIWQGEMNYIELNPVKMPFHIFRVYRRLRREADFDYYQ